MKKSRPALLALLTVLLPAIAQAHKAWLLPSQTVLSDAGGWITVDAAVSNDLFFFNHVPLPLDSLSAVAPDGKLLQPQNLARGVYRGTFDLQLQQAGTYRIAVSGDTVIAAYEEGGQKKRWRGTPQTLSQLPQGISKLQIEHYANRVETFVTVGKPGALSKVSGAGLELVPVTHPNDLYAGEAAKLRFVLDGKPAVGAEVMIVAGGSRYRDQQEERTLQTDAQGEIRITWPAAGMYWLEASISDDKVVVPGAKGRNASYIATLEVLPQ